MLVEVLLSEISWKAVKSSGPGGQHVNKTSSKVELSFNLHNSRAFSDSEKELLNKKLKNRLSDDGTFTLQCSESRSQHRNKKIAMDRLINLLQENLKKPKPRKKTKPSKSAIEKRLKSKKDQALKKARRKPPSMD